MVFWLLLLMAPRLALSNGEGTRHITGEGVDLYFMQDKLFGSVGGHPLWAIYRCGSEIRGEVDIGGTYHKLSFRYHREGDRIITGVFGSTPMALGKIEKREQGFVYHVFVDGEEYGFSINYTRMENEHMVNSVIEGSLPNHKEITLTVDGHLCPFATTGIILIIAGSAALS